MTVAELNPVELFALIVTAVLWGVYGPALLWRHYKSREGEWEVGALIMMGFAAFVIVVLPYVQTAFFTFRQ